MLSPKELSDVFEAYDAITEAYASLERPEIIHKSVAISATQLQADGIFNDMQVAMVLAYNDGIFAGHKIASEKYFMEDEE